MTDRDLERLKVFVDKTIELEQAVKDHLLQRVTLSYNTNGDNAVNTNAFLDSIVEAGLVALIRQFIDDQETAYFNGICNILSSYHRSDAEKVTRLRQFKKAWKEKILGHNGVLGIEINGETLSNHELLKLIAYTGRIHTDIDVENYQHSKVMKLSGFSPIFQLQLSTMIEGASILSSAIRHEFVQPIMDSNPTDQ